jgi:hypothetical protein
MLHVREAEHVGKPAVDGMSVRQSRRTRRDHDGQPAVARSGDQVQHDIAKAGISPLDVIDEHDQRPSLHDLLDPLVDGTDRIPGVHPIEAGLRPSSGTRRGPQRRTQWGQAGRQGL